MAGDLGVWAKVSNSNSMCDYSLKQPLFDVRSDPQSWLLKNTKNGKPVVYPETWDCLYEKISDPCGRQWQEANICRVCALRRSLSRPISKAPPLKAAGGWCDMSRSETCCWVSQQQLVGGLEPWIFMTFQWESSSQLTNSIIFQRGRAQPPTRQQNRRIHWID